MVGLLLNNYFIIFFDKSISAIKMDADTEEVLATLISCLKDIIYAHGGVDKLIEKFKPDIHRQTIYNLLKYPDAEKRKHGPEFLTIYKLIRSCGAVLRAA